MSTLSRVGFLGPKREHPTAQSRQTARAPGGPAVQLFPRCRPRTRGKLSHPQHRCPHGRTRGRIARKMTPIRNSQTDSMQQVAQMTVRTWIGIGVALVTATAVTGQDGPHVHQHVEVYNEPGRFAGWPANNGIWSWDNEIVVGFTLGYHKEKSGHTIDPDRPSGPQQARSLDGGLTWTIETPSYVGEDGKERETTAFSGADRFHRPRVRGAIPERPVLLLPRPLPHLGGAVPVADVRAARPARPDRLHRRGSTPIDRLRRRREGERRRGPASLHPNDRRRQDLGACRVDRPATAGGLRLRHHARHRGARREART